MNFVNKLRLIDQEYKTKWKYKGLKLEGKVRISYELLLVIWNRPSVNKCFVHQILKRKKLWSSKSIISPCLHFRHNSFFT